MVVSAGLSSELIITVALMAYCPAIIYAILIRYVEKYDREPWGSISVAFLWGATLAVIIVTMVKGWFLTDVPNMYPDIASNSKEFYLYGDVLLLPFVAELVKLAGAYWVYDEMEEAEDGFIYGSVIGLGYAATKVLINGISVGVLYGTDELFSRVIIASVSLLLTNASITAISVYGVSRVTARKHTKKHSAISAVPFFLIAVGMSMLFSYVVNFGSTIFSEDLQSNFIIANSLVLTVSIVYALIISIVVYAKVWRLDRLDEKIEKEKQMTARRIQSRSITLPPPRPPRDLVNRAHRDVMNRTYETPHDPPPSSTKVSTESEVDEDEWELVEEDSTNIIEDDDWMDV